MRLSTVLIAVLGVLLGTAQGRRRRLRDDCPEERLKVREALADVVLTGTLKRFYSSQDALYSGEVLVKRVVKGDHLRAGESLLVEGFGHPDICASRPLLKDSKIFLLTQLDTGRFRLNSSLVTINGPNLEKMTASVKGVPYRRRNPIVDEPCEKKWCQFNGDCFEESRRAVCRCPPGCSERGPAVCGSDGRTYPAECHLRMHSCRNKRPMYVRHEGHCATH